VRKRKRRPSSGKTIPGVANNSVDTRELKDSAAEYLKKSQFDKAAEVLERLVQSEPKEMQHRLRLGDCYRRLEDTGKAIKQYDTVGRYYADQDQFIKAIAAFKVILEIDPRNAEARKQLSRMNERRLSKDTLDSADLSRGKTAPVPAANEVEAIELPEGDPACMRKVPTQEPPDYGRELVFDDESERFSTGKRSKHVTAPPPPTAFEAAVSAGDEQGEIEELPEGAILEPATERPITRPIADLLSTDAEREIEVLAISSEVRPDEPPGEKEAATQDIEEAIGSIAASTGKRRKLPTRVPLFDDLPRDAFFELVNRLSYRRYQAGEQILKEGEPGRSFFVIVDGNVRIWKNLADGSELELATLDEGAFFGEMALLSGAPRMANVSAEMDTELLEVSDAVLWELSRKYPHIAQSLKNFYRRRLLNNVMAISPLFKDIDPSERQRIVEKFKIRKAAPGEMLLKQGSPSDGLYVVLHGSVEVAAKHIPLAKLREGDIFGEMSLLTRRPATATVTSSGNSILLRLAKERFQELLVTHPQILALVSELTERRAAATRAALERHSISSFV
jgi:CRP-like cAMP-binding protein